MKAALTPEQVRPLVLYSLVSHNVFTDRFNSDFFSGLLPFFAPLISENDGEIFDPDEFARYGATVLHMQFTRDIGDIFVDRMIKAGWLIRETQNYQGVIYRCKLSEPLEKGEEYKNVEAQLDKVIDAFLSSAADHRKNISLISRSEIENSFLSFLVRYSSGEADPFSQGEIRESQKITEEQLDYLFARFVGQVSQSDQKLFGQIEMLAGTSLLSEALIALRTPNAGLPAKTDLLVFVDGPLLMDYLGLSGKPAKENANYIIGKLKKIGVTFSCFKHTSDEIRDNLLAVLGRPIFERSGPTAEAYPVWPALACPRRGISQRCRAAFSTA